MAMKFNTNLAIALVALAVVGISFASSANTGFGIVNSYGVEINPANVACADTDGSNANTLGACSDSSGKTLTDTCGDYGPYVSEAFCSASNKCATKMILCDSDKLCKNGVCVVV